MTITITHSEVLEALANADAGSLDARTLRELMDETGIGIIAMKRALQRIRAEGRLQVHRVRRTAMDGRNALVPAYTITPAKKRKG